MRRAWLAGAVGLFGLIGWMGMAKAQQAAALQWIWFNEGDPAKEAPTGTRYFRQTFQLSRQFADAASLDITADHQFTVWLNGVKIGQGNDWKRVYAFDVKKHLVQGKNVIAVEARNTEGPAGLLVRLNYVPNGQSKLKVLSDGSWKASKSALPGWEKNDFNDDSWPAAKELGAYGKVGRWKGQVWDAGGDDRFAVPAGFRVEEVAKNPDPKDPFSLINLCFDAKGRLLVSKERGPILLCTQPDKDGVFQSVKPYCEQVKGCQGMCWVRDALLLVGDGPQGTGLYRVRDTDGDDKTDKVELLHKFNGGMGEHGPHAIIHGPDDWLYLVIGNHAWAKPDKLAANSPLTRWPHGQMGHDQGKPGTTEDVLLPRLNDARGHAANILAPGGTIWRLDHDGKNMSLVTAGFRNHFDAAFSPTGELFTFDSDMEWDENLPWYRAVRVCHCPPGADFVWRTGAANTPDYYIDSLPPLAETGRGSPVGVEFYDHGVFPQKYRGALFLSDWSLGIIYVAFLERDGASYKAKVERFCTGNPMNVTDCAVGPDGALYFTMGGRGTQGGVYRIAFGAAKGPRVPQGFHPLSAGGRAIIEASNRKYGKDKVLDQESQERLKAILFGSSNPVARLNALKQMHMFLSPLDPDLLTKVIREDKDGEVRAFAVYLLGLQEKASSKLLIASLKDSDALARRRACEALIRAGIEPPVEALWPLLGENDRFLRTAARLVLQRIDPKKWADRLWKEPNDLVAEEGIIALCKTNQAAPYAEPFFGRLHGTASKESTQALLNYLRTVQMALVHVGARPIWVRAIAEKCVNLFPHKDSRVNRELAILLTQFRREGQTDRPVHAQLLHALLSAAADRQQQIHYFYCLRLLHEGWTPQEKSELLAWFDSAKDWQGGYSFTPFLENILRDLEPVFKLEDRSAIVAQGERYPWAAAVLLKQAPAPQLPAPAALANLYAQLTRHTSNGQAVPHRDELKEAIIAALGRSTLPEAQRDLRQIGDREPGQRDAVARGLARSPTAENWPYLVRSLETSNPVLLLDLVEALKKDPAKPKAEDPAPYRSLLLASRRLDAKNRWKVVEVLRHWNNRQFGADAGDSKPELSAWSKWFAQSFPKEPALPDVAADKPAVSKYKFEELLGFLEKDPAGRTGNAARGRVVFEKAQCLKCHKYGKEGEGIGPDLTTLSKRFKRSDTLESLIYPSKVISDQYRSILIVTKRGQQINGLAAPQGDNVTVLQSDGTKLTLARSDIEQQFASLVSVMPEKLLDTLTKQEIADLFAFLESEPAK